MRRILLLVVLMMIGVIQSNYVNAQSQTSFGGDTYLQGSDSTLSTNVPRDVFASGFSVSLDGRISGDAHAAGFDVDINGDIAGDLYAAGSNISIKSKIDEDLSASGFTVHLENAAAIGGNVRLAGGTVTIDAPVTGSLVAAGGNVKLNAPIQGDVSITASNITFGPDAKILGKLIYSSREKMDIPESVIAQSKVEFKQLTHRGMASEVSDRFEESMSHFWPSFFGVIATFIITLAFLLIVMAIALSFMEERVERLRQRAADHYGASMLFGLLGLSTLFGLVPVSAMTIVGIPFVPIVLLLIVTFWIAGYLLGVYTISWRIAGAFQTLKDTKMTRLVVVAIGLVAIAFLNFIPIVGALFNFLLVLLCLGSIVISAINCLMTMEVFSSIPDSKIASAPKKKL